MARRQVVEVICDRCSKTETQEPSQRPKAPGSSESPELTISFHGESKKYEDLCMRCRRACESYFKQITKQVEKDDIPKGHPKKPGILGIGSRKTG